MVFKTCTNGHKHPSLSLIIIEQGTIVETKENNKWHSAQKPCTLQNSRIDCDEVQLHHYWTPLPVYVYTRHITRTKNAYVEINIYQHRVSAREQRSSGGNTSSNPQVLALIPRHAINRWRGCVSNVMLLSLQYNAYSQQLLDAVQRPECIGGPWWSIVARRLTLSFNQNRYQVGIIWFINS